MIDDKGYRHGVGVVLVNDDNKVFFAKRLGQNDAWQFPQGGLMDGESYEEALFRELYEEIGLEKDHVTVLTKTNQLLAYDLPEKFIRKYSFPKCIGQKHQWFLLKLNTNCERHISLTTTAHQEFDAWTWVDYHEPAKKVVNFKKPAYQQALMEFERFVLKIA